MLGKLNTYLQFSWFGHYFVSVTIKSVFKDWRKVFYIFKLHRHDCKVLQKLIYITSINSLFLFIWLSILLVTTSWCWNALLTPWKNGTLQRLCKLWKKDLQAPYLKDYFASKQIDHSINLKCKNEVHWDQFISSWLKLPLTIW